MRFKRGKSFAMLVVSFTVLMGSVITASAAEAPKADLRWYAEHLRDVAYGDVNDIGDHFYLGSSSPDSNNDVYVINKKDTCLIMLNGTYTPYLAKMRDGNAYIAPTSANVMFGLNDDGDYNEKYQVFKNSNFNIKFTSGSKLATVNGNTIDAKLNSFVEDGRLFVPLNFLATTLGYKVAYSKDLMTVPTLSIDGVYSTKVISKDQSIINTKAVLNNALVNFASELNKNSDYNKNGAITMKSPQIAQIKDKIDNLTYSGDFSRYYIFDGPYKIYVDKYNGDVYMPQSFISRSFMERVSSTEYKDAFIEDYFAG